MITKEQYECAKHTVHSIIPTLLSESIWTMKNEKSYREALRVIDEYIKQVKQSNITSKTQEITK